MFLITIPIFFVYYFKGMILETAFLIYSCAALIVYIILFNSATKTYFLGISRNLVWVPAVPLRISIIIPYFVVKCFTASLVTIGFAFTYIPI